MFSNVYPKISTTLEKEREEESTRVSCATVDSLIFPALLITFLYFIQVISLGSNARLMRKQGKSLEARGLLMIVQTVLRDERANRYRTGPLLGV
jgi:hypothetical protein